MIEDNILSVDSLLHKIIKGGEAYDYIRGINTTYADIGVSHLSGSPVQKKIVILEPSKL